MWRCGRFAQFLVLVGTVAALVHACGDDPKRPLGATCEDDGECLSGLCLEGACLDPSDDPDGDTLSNGVEGALGTSPSLVDTDQDGELDPDELDAELRHLDADQDGKPDALESALADSDGDCIVDELDPDDGAIDPNGCAANAGDWSCGHIYQADRSRPSGIYMIDPDASGPEPALRVECLMGVANGGWTRLADAWHAWLERAPIAPVPRREYLYVTTVGWSRTAPTIVPWSWEDGVAVPGVWFMEDAAGALDTRACGREDVDGIGFGCAGGPWLAAKSGGSASGSATLCLGVTCEDEVAVYVRDLPCPGAPGELLGDTGFDAFATGASSCWRLPLATPPDRPGAGVSADSVGAREGHAPALRADYFDTFGVWLTELEYRSVDRSGHNAYRLSFWARAAEPRPMFVSDDGDSADASTFVSLTTDWRVYEVNVVPDETELDVSPQIMFGQLDTEASVWIDDVGMIDLGPFECTPPDGELLGDGGFTAGTACWVAMAWDDEASGRFVADVDAPIASDAPSLRIDHDLQTPGTGPVLLQLTPPLQPGHGYELALDARGVRELLRVRLATARSNGWPTDSEHLLGESWAPVVVRWDTALDYIDTEGAIVELDPSGVGPGTVWIDNARLVDLGADPCLQATWQSRGRVPDGGFDFGVRCWTVSAGVDTIVEPDFDEAAPGALTPTLRTTNGTSVAPVDIASAPFDLPAGSWGLELWTRTSGARSLTLEVLDESGAVVLSRPLAVSLPWGQYTERFELPSARRVTVHLRASGTEPGALWVDGVMVR